KLAALPGTPSERECCTSYGVRPSMTTRAVDNQWPGPHIHILTNDFFLVFRAAQDSNEAT
ncbi:hypothetical protein, partial [Shigella boydii]|uniref:hypothetical protein n=1 Tax=Shigella boydii TaxID=621 RepID=UPI001C0A7B16